MFRTLDDYKSKESKADKKTTESYAGGEKSGMAVENPDDILGVINKAKENSEKNKDQPDREKPDTEVRITLYQNGFTVEGGEFRDYNTPENKEFMKELNEGYIPKELRKKYNKQIGIALEDKRDTKFRPPTPPKYVAYSGEG
jgi:UBX domain-containing protein 1